MVTSLSKLRRILDEMNNRFTNELQVKTREIQQLEQELRRISSRGVSYR